MSHSNEVFLRHLKAHNLCSKAFFFHYSLATSMIHEVQSHWYFMHVGIHQVRILVIANTKGVQCLSIRGLKPSSNTLDCQ